MFFVLSLQDIGSDINTAGAWCVRYVKRDGAAAAETDDAEHWDQQVSLLQYSSSNYRYQTYVYLGFESPR